MPERWKDVVGSDGRYQVSSEGRVRAWTHPAGRKGPGYRTPEPRDVAVYLKGGHPAVCMAMRHGEKQRDYYVARLLLDAFVGPSQGRKAEYIDGPELALSNLRWKVAPAIDVDAIRARRALHDEARAQADAVKMERAASARREAELRLKAKGAKVEDGERWLPVRGHEGRYEVSDMGRVRSLVAGDARVLALGMSNRGRPKVGIGGRMLDVHVVVLDAFVGSRPPGMEASHVNGDRADNRAVNLAWETHAENEGRKASHKAARHEAIKQRPLGPCQP